MKGWFKSDRIFRSVNAYLIKLWPMNLLFGSTFIANLGPLDALPITALFSTK